MRPAAATRRCSAARIRVEVNSSAPATVYTLRTVDPTQLRRLADAIARRAREIDRMCSASATSRSTSCSTLSAGKLYGPDLALRFGADMPALPGRAAVLPAANTFSAVAVTHSASRRARRWSPGGELVLIMA